MERVTGIGGFFFRSKDPTTLARWYEDVLRVTLTPRDYDATACDKKPARFARLNDPEGNPIQLWQPGGKDPG
jgi:hypothetical protein